MTNEEKAREIALDAKERGFGATEAYCAAMEMAEWKDKVKPTLTTDDIMLILNIESEFQEENSILDIQKMSYREYCEEILKRYLEKLPKEEE